MAAGAAQAEMSIGGLYAGTIYDAPGAATSQAVSTNSIYVSYSDSMDNGMGVSVAMSVSDAGAIKTDVNIDTGFGTLGLGDGQDSAVDTMDGSPAIFSINPYGPRFGSSFTDGDTASGESIAFTTPSLGGVTAKVTYGFDDDYAGDNVISMAASTSIMGASIKAGLTQLDPTSGTSADPSFVTVSYSMAGLSLGYAMYDTDVASTGEETQFGVGTSLMGMDAGITFATNDTTGVDTDYMLVSLTKGMGAASFGVDYLETDASNADGTDTWAFTYVVGF
jgi:predicted porin